MASVTKTEEELVSTRTVINDVPVVGQDNLQIVVIIGSAPEPNLQDGGKDNELLLEETLHDGGQDDELQSETTLEDGN